MACDVNNVGAAQLLVEHLQVDVNMLCDTGCIRQRSPLQCAARRGHRAMVEFLITVPGLDVNAVNAQGFSALHYAAGGGHRGVVELLVTVPGVEVHACVSMGWTALHFAANRGSRDIVECLLTVPGTSVDVNAVGRIGAGVRWTALHFAVHGGHRDVVERLLMVPGIDVDAVGYGGAETARQLAARKGYHEIVELFDSVGA